MKKDRMTKWSVVVGSHGNYGSGYVVTTYASGKVVTGKVRRGSVAAPAWVDTVEPRKSFVAYGEMYEYTRPN